MARRRVDDAEPQLALALAQAAKGPADNHLTDPELAAHWQFADSSHFIRAFKKHYGRTPTDYARSITAARN